MPLGCKNKNVGVDHFLCPGGDGRSYTSELGESGGRVVGVTVWVYEIVEGRTLVSGQRDTVLDAQWQVGLESEESQDLIHHSRSDG